MDDSECTALVAELTKTLMVYAAKHSVSKITSMRSCYLLLINVSKAVLREAPQHERKPLLLVLDGFHKDMLAALSEVFNNPNKTRDNDN